MSDHIDFDSDPVIAAWVQAIRQIDADMAELKARRDRAADVIKDRLGDHTEARIGGQPVVTWAWSKPGQRLDRKKLEEAFGAEVIATYLVDNQPARPFKILEAKP